MAQGRVGKGFPYSYNASGAEASSSIKPIIVPQFVDLDPLFVVGRRHHQRHHRRRTFASASKGCYQSAAGS